MHARITGAASCSTVMLARLIPLVEIGVRRAATTTGRPWLPGKSLKSGHRSIRDGLPHLVAGRLACGRSWELLGAVPASREV